MLQTSEDFQRDSDSRHNWAKQALKTGVRTAQEQCHGDGPSKTTSQWAEKNIRHSNLKAFKRAVKMRN